jgi:orotate phosphoribosyltransferase
MIEQEIRMLLDGPAVGGDAPTLTHVEDTLTAGYARAMALEAERLRLERRIAEIAAEIDREVELHSSELRTLARRVEGATADLANLRALLELLRERAAKIRAAAA